MNTEAYMNIKPFEEHKDQLFTDYAMQLFNAHCSENSHDMIKFFINSLADEAEDNPVFLPGLVFGCMVHMLLMMQSIALEKEMSLEEAKNIYINMYQENRKNLSKMLGNRPDYAKDIIGQISSEDDL